MTYYLDTNIVLAFLRQSKVADAVSNIFELTDHNQICISEVTAGELWSIATQNNWGAIRRAQLQYLLDSYVRTAVADEELIRRYADIDAFSQNKLKDQPLGTTARNMGKNDLWIGASASLAGAILITTDKDFDHLHEVFVDVVWLDPTRYN